MLYLRDTPKPLSGLRGGTCRARPTELRLAHREMMRDLVVQVLIQPRACEERADPKAHAVQQLGHVSLDQVASSTRLIAALVRRQESVVSVSRFRPAAVSR